MRKPRYYSPSAISTWQYSPEGYYLKYLSDRPTPRTSQTMPMAIGSGFDAFIKSYLHQRLFGKNHKDSAEYECRKLFEDQVDSALQEWCWPEATFVFDKYIESGAAADLLLLMDKSVDEPRFEFVLEDTVTTNIGEINLLGKPDLYFTNEQGARVILDWKVNGYCRKGNTSPMKGYIRLRPGDKQHKDCHLTTFRGVLINCAMFLEQGNTSWSDQLSIYSWLLGEPFGSENMITGIEQITGNGDKLRIASHRLRISPDYQFELLALIEQLHETIESGWIFRDMSEEDSAARCALLDLPDGEEMDY